MGKDRHFSVREELRTNGRKEGRKVRNMRLRWSRGSVLAFGTQVGGFKPGHSRRIFQGEKILSTPSFGREVKPFVPCRRFTWKSGIFGQNSSTISRPSSSSFHYKGLW